MPFLRWYLVSVRRSAGRPIIPPKQQHKLADLCRVLDIQPYVLRYWQTEFPVLASMKGAGARREYDADDVETIRRIKELLYDEGYTIARAKKQLASELEEGGVRGRPVIVTGAPADNGEAPARQTPGGDVETQEAARMPGGSNRPLTAHGALTAGPVPDAQPAALPPGSRIAEYEIVRVLGAGGFGITYLAFDHRLDGPVAIKEYFPADLAARGDGWKVSATAASNRDVFAWGLDRFLDEARAIHRFRHPNVVRAHRYLEANGTAYIVMEYVEGESLKAILDRRGRLSPEEWRPWMEALLEGLAHVHSHDYLHRDIKPANIVVRAEDGEPVLIDFGSARAQHRDRTHTQVLTAGYAPIEQYSTGAEQGPAADIYALAAVSYKVLTESTVASAPDRVLNDEYLPLAKQVAGADSRWLAAIDHGLTLRPQDRPESLADWCEALGSPHVASANKANAAPLRAVRRREEHAAERALILPDEAPGIPEKPPAGKRSRHLWWVVPALFSLALVILRLATGPIGDSQSADSVHTSRSMERESASDLSGHADSRPPQPRDDVEAETRPLQRTSPSSTDSTSPERSTSAGSTANPPSTPQSAAPADQRRYTVEQLQEGLKRAKAEGNEAAAAKFEALIAQAEEAPSPTRPADREVDRGSTPNEALVATSAGVSTIRAGRASSGDAEAASAEPVDLPYFTLGSHQDDVLRLEGTPTRIRRFDSLGHETWSYGLSRVTISTRTREVLDWTNHGGQLKVRLPPGDSGTDLPYFSRGSHQDDVLRTQGTPTRIRRFDSLGHETWSYGLSRVTISTRTREVLDWTNHGGQLKVRLPPGDSGTDLPYFSRGSHQDDVLRTQGTPTRIRRFDSLGHETWSYGLSRVTISTRTREVLDWTNHGGQLKVKLSGQP